MPMGCFCVQKTVAESFYSKIEIFLNHLVAVGSSLQEENFGLKQEGGKLFKRGF